MITQSLVQKMPGALRRSSAVIRFFIRTRRIGEAPRRAVTIAAMVLVMLGIVAHPALSAETARPVDAMIAELAQRLEQSPGDAEGWRMLGWSYFNTGRYQEAATAYAKAAELKPSELSYRSAQAEAMVQAAGGLVTPEALALFRSVTDQDASEERSRFYLALAAEQAGDATEALMLWQALLADAPPDAPWLVDVRQHIASLGGDTGNSAGAAATAPEKVKDPHQKQGELNAAVAELKARLEKNPKDRDGWIMLIRSLKKTGDEAGALAARRDALGVFADDAVGQLAIVSAARD